ncbi:MAG TPA: 23S rRNA (pseudouridine(1915)-N(3))-methyltransferase RlmH [Burkholderiales bacterium]|nr:23S rRNA (pseudouridine(1915)-N(3))-methyltransferase RlmH [Burkholderiales bacterium]
MKLHILAVGHRMPAWVQAGFEDYARRMPREMPLLLAEVRPEARGTGVLSAARIERILKLESERLRAAAPQGCLLVALDEGGQALTTERLARRLEGWLQQGRDVCFAIGGADGLDADLKRSAHLMLSVSAMTLPHQLVRVILAEQLYRAVSLLRHHPYHRG